MPVNLAFGKVLSDLRTSGGKGDISECSKKHVFVKRDQVTWV